MERNNISRCLGGLRLEDQGERSPQTFLAKTRRSVRSLVSFAPGAGGGGGVRDISLGGEVRRGSSYPDPV